MSTETFQAALGKLVNDVRFRDAVANDVSVLTKEFKLSVGELGVLMSVGNTCIGTASGAAGTTSALAARDGDVNCCCCCCCP